MTPKTRRWAFRLAFVFALFFLLHTPPLKELFRLLLVKTAPLAVGGAIDARRLDYRLWRGEIVLENLHVRLGQALSIDAERLELRLPLFGRVRVRVQNPEIRVEDALASGSLAQNPVEIAIPTVVGELAVEGARFRAPGIEIAPFDLSLQRQDGTYYGSLRAEGGRAGVAGGDIPLGVIEARLHVARGTLEITDLHIQSRGSAVSGYGTLTRLSPAEGRFDVHFQTDASVARAWDAHAPIAFRVKGTAQLEIHSGAIEIEAKSHAEDLAWGDVGPWAGDVDVLFRQNILRISRARLKGLEGTIQAEGQIALSQPAVHSLAVEFENVNVGKLLEKATGRRLPIATRARGEGTILLPGYDFSHATGRANVSLEEGAPATGVPVRGRIVLTATEGRLEATYEASLADLGRLGRLAPALTDSSGSLSLTGTLRGRSDDLTLSSVVSGENLTIWGQPIGSLSAKIQSKTDRIDVESLSLGAPGRRLTARGGLALGGAGWDLAVDLDGVPFTGLAQRLNLPLRGTVSGNAKLTGPALDPDVEAQLRVFPEYRGVVAQVAVGVHKSGHLVRFEPVSSALLGGTVEGEGQVDLLANRLTATLTGAALQIPAPVPDFLASCGFTLTLEGPVKHPSGQGDVQLTDVSYRGAPLPSLRARARSDGTAVHVETSLLEGHEVASANASLTAPYPVNVDVDLGALPFDEFFAAFPELRSGEPVLETTGRLEINFDAPAPRDLRYVARVERLFGHYHGIAGGAGAPFLLEGDLEALRVTDLELVGTETAVSVGGRLPLRRDGDLNLGLRGSVRLELAQPLFPSVTFGGVANLDVAFTGTPRAPGLVGTASLGEAQVALGRLRVENVTAELEGEAGRLHLLSLQGQLLDGSFEMSGELPLPRPDALHPARLDVRINRFNLGDLAEPGMDGAIRPELRVSASGTIEAPTLDLHALSGEGRIRELRAGLGALPMESPEEAPFRLDGGKIFLPSLPLSGGATRLEASVETSFADGPVTWEATLRGSLDNGFFNPVLEPFAGMLASGSTVLDLRQTGGPDGTHYLGQGSIEGARLVVREPPVSLSDIEGQIRFDGRSLVLSELKASVGGGSVSGEGRIELEGFAGIGRIELAATADQVRLNYPEGLRTETSGELSFTGSRNRYRLAGDVRLLRGLFDRRLSVQTEIISALGREAARLTARDSFEEKVDLDLRVRTEGDLRIANNVAQLNSTATLSVAGTLARPEVTGILTAANRGTFVLGRNTYLLDAGRIQLNGYPTEPPEIDLRARTTVSGIEILLEAKGPPDDIHSELSAPNRPDLTRADLASLLLTGRVLARTDASGSRGLSDLTGSEILGEQLVSVVSGSLADLAQRGLGQALPFDQVSIAPVLVAGEQDPGARFSLSKSITPEVMLTYSVGLNDTEGQLWILDYKLPRKLTFRGIRKDDNEFNVGLAQTLPLDLYRRPRLADSEDRAQPRIAVIDVTGEIPLSMAERAGAIGLKPGDRYDYWKSLKAADRLREKLARAGYLNAVVDVDAQEFAERGVSVRFRVEAGPAVRVLWQGDDPGRRVRRKVENEWDGRVPEEILLLELAAGAARELKRQRFYEASVSASAADVGDHRVVTLRVKKGPRGERVVLDFDGNEAVSDRELTSVLPPISSASFYELVGERPLRLRETIALHYASLGYIDARVQAPVTRYDAKAKVLTVRVPVEEGPRANVARVRVEGAAALPVERLLNAMQLHAGEPFLLPAHLHDRAAVAAFYRRNGFTEAHVDAAVERTAEGVDVLFRVEEGPRALVGPVRVEGLHATRESVVRRELTFKPGEPLQSAALVETQRQLYDLGIFRTAEVLAPSSEGSTVEREVVVAVAEAPDLELSYGLRYDTETGMEALLDLQAPNLFGRAQHAGLTILLNPNQSVFRASFHAPYLSFHRIDTDVFVGQEIEEDASSLTRSLRLTFQQARFLRKKLRLQWSYNFVRSQTVGKVETGPFPFDITTIRAPLTASLIEDKRDNVINPHKGRFWSASFQLSPGALAADIRFVKLFGQLFLYTPLSRNLVWASAYRLGLADGFDQFLLKEDRFQAGGPSSVRGFSQNSLGSVDPVTGTVIGGESVAVFNQELRFPIYRWFGGVLFYDAGNTFATVSDLDFTELRHSAGAGFRLSFPFGLFRVDWARVLDPRPGEPRSRYVFSIGHAF